MDGDFYMILDSKTKYHNMPFHRVNSTGWYNIDKYKNGYYFGAYELNGVQTTLNRMSSMIQAAFPQQYSTFSAITGYVITWNIGHSSGPTTVYQVILAKDEIHSFMILLYEQLGVPTDVEHLFISDASGNSFPINASTTDSNCGVPGQFIYSLNAQTS
jgi:hypothetical protein